MALITSPDNSNHHPFLGSAERANSGLPTNGLRDAADVYTVKHVFTHSRQMMRAENLGLTNEGPI